MPRIIWDETFSVNEKEIDEQHQKWISIINELHDSLIQGKNLTNITGKSLKSMADYGEFHFRFEEAYMEKQGYEDLENHKIEHEKFREMIKKYVRDEEDGKLILNTEVMKVLMDWLTNHILITDKKYSSPARS
ncbi:MAG: bacteriohemerythrin [Desulfobulbaceae bacterium]|nr:bacteriohemerythrin [Desulfobulbaceae bacterium]